MELSTFQKLLLFGLEKGASDIHFEVGYPVHYRIRGDLLASKTPPLKNGDTEAVARLVLGERQIDLQRLFAEQDVSYQMPNSGRFRASVFRQRGAVGVVMRSIPLEVQTFEQLSLPPVLADLAGARRGLILVTGATGNGKSTTLAAMIRHINETRRALVVTIEDPIEFLFPQGKCMIVQREVGTDTGSFREALTAAMRQNPDVIMVGEIRDRETAEIVLRAAETGHLIFASIHTPDTIATIARYVGMFPSAEQDLMRERLGDALAAVVSLRLLTMKNGQGRAPAVEVLRVTQTIRECVRSNRLADVAQHLIKGRDLYGMQSFDQHLLELVKRDLISLETATMAASNPDDLERTINFE